MKSRKMLALKITRDTFEENPRIPFVHLHHKIREKTGVRMRETTTRYIEEGLNRGIIQPPRPYLKYYTNVHQHVFFFEGNLLDFEDFVAEEKKNIRYACALTGSSEIIMVTSFSCPGQDLLSLAFTRADGYNTPECHCLESLQRSFNEPSPISISSRRLHWDEIDWKLFYTLSPDLRIPYADLSKRINLGWRAIKNRMEKKIYPSCCVAAYFFPKGVSNYQELYVQFKTEYQENFLKKLDLFPSTVYFLLYECREVGLFLFPENINRVIKFFKKVEIEGIIDDFRYLTPIGWYHSEGSRWTGPGT